MYCTMANPKPISATAVRNHDIIVRSTLRRVRTQAKWLSAVTLTSNLAAPGALRGSDMSVLLRGLMRGCAVPPASDARGRPADDHVRDKRKQQCDDDRLARIELAQHDDLVNRIHHEPEEDDPGGRVQPFIQSLGALARV